MKQKVLQLLSRLADVEKQLGDPSALNDQKQYRALTQEHSYLSEIRTVSETIDTIENQLKDNEILLKIEKDPAFTEVLKEDSVALEKRKAELYTKLEHLLIPPDPRDSCNIILEIRAGTGGDEAALFVGDCVRMYQLYATKQGWRTETISCAESDLGGFKEYIMALSGRNVHRLMQYEGGTHRVQRVPATEAQGRIHTSAITIAILLEPDEDTQVVVEDKDLRIDTFRASGAGGQHVNRTDSAVRITHIPTGIVVGCQEERSQHKNKEKAMRVLKAKILEQQMQKQQEAIAASRSAQVGTGDRSERIRTYNFPQNRLTDHRINLTIYNLDGVMEGDYLDEIQQALVAHYRQQQLEGIAKHPQGV